MPCHATTDPFLRGIFYFFAFLAWTRVCPFFFVLKIHQSFWRKYSLPLPAKFLEQLLKILWRDDDAKTSDELLQFQIMLLKFVAKSGDLLLQILFLVVALLCGQGRTFVDRLQLLVDGSQMVHAMVCGLQLFVLPCELLKKCAHSLPEVTLFYLERGNRHSGLGFRGGMLFQ